MSWTPPRTWVIGEILTKANLDEQVRDNLTFLKVNIALESAVELTIAGGIVTKSRAHHTIDTQGDAASDELDTINGGSEGEVILVRAADGARTVILKHGTGNIWNPAEEDITLDDAGDYCFLVYNGTNWCAISGGLSAGAIAGLIAAHAALDTGVHGAGGDVLATDQDIADHAGNANAHHNQVHDIDGADHNGVAGAIENDLISFDASGLPKDSGVLSTDILSVISAPSGFTIIFVPTSTGLYYEGTNHDVRIRTSVAVAGDNILLAQGFNWKNNGLLILA